MGSTEPNPARIFGLHVGIHGQLVEVPGSVEVLLIWRVEFPFLRRLFRSVLSSLRVL